MADCAISSFFLRYIAAEPSVSGGRDPSSFYVNDCAEAGAYYSRSAVLAKLRGCKLEIRQDFCYKIQKNCGEIQKMG